MGTVPEFELEQKISELVHFVKNYAEHHEGDFKVKTKREDAILSCIDNDVSLYFTV